MEPGKFIAEFYRRRDQRHPEMAGDYDRPWAAVAADPAVRQMVESYRSVLPADRDARILDIGFGYGEFLAACIALGYRNVEGADFGVSLRAGMKAWGVSAIHEIEEDIGSFLAGRAEEYDFIHFSHVIEHLPKYSLFYHLDGIYRALRVGGTFFIRTPNMDGPRGLSTRYATITHETGFTGFSLQTLLEACSFDNIRYVEMRGTRSARQQVVALVRGLLIRTNAFMHRLFGAVSYGHQFGEELVVSAQRLDRPPLFDPDLR